MKGVPKENIVYEVLDFLKNVLVSSRKIIKKTKNDTVGRY